MPSIGTTEWWVHSEGSHFASPKSEIYNNIQPKKEKKIIRENSEIYQVYISILNINSKRVFYKKKEVKRVPVDQNLESIEC